MKGRAIYYQVKEIGISYLKYCLPQPQAMPLLRFFISMIKISIFKFQRKAEVN